MNVDPDDLRIFAYDHIVAKGLPPTLEEIAEHFGVSRSSACEALASLKIGKTILVHPQSGEIWMAGPFSAVKTDYEVVAVDRTYYANCAWDMLGIPMILNAAAQARTKCTDCGSAMTIDCDPSHPPIEDAVVHFLVPARHWYDDIGFT
jgi:Alkylmercury lyase/Bacterial regulatory proteins, gntR family